MKFLKKIVTAYAYYEVVCAGRYLCDKTYKSIKKHYQKAMEKAWKEGSDAGYKEGFKDGVKFKI